MSNQLFNLYMKETVLNYFLKTKKKKMRHKIFNTFFILKN